MKPRRGPFLIVRKSPSAMLLPTHTWPYVASGERAHRNTRGGLLQCPRLEPGSKEEPAGDLYAAAISVLPLQVEGLRATVLQEIVHIHWEYFLRMGSQLMSTDSAHHGRGVNHTLATKSETRGMELSCGHTPSHCQHSKAGFGEIGEIRLKSANKHA